MLVAAKKGKGREVDCGGQWGDYCREAMDHGKEALLGTRKLCSLMDRNPRVSREVFAI